MKDIELPIASIRWPEACCSCGSRTFAWRQHTEKVVLWTIISVTRYREVTLRIPVCSNCTMRSWGWYGGAAALWGLGYLVISIAESHHRDLGGAFAIPFVIGIALAIKGTRTAPLRILKFDPDLGRAVLKINDDKVALAVAKASGGHVSLEEGTRMRRLLIIGAALLGAMVVFSVVMRHLGN
jgi:hypothetical protein